MEIVSKHAKTTTYLMYCINIKEHKSKCKKEAAFTFEINTTINTYLH